MSMNSGALLMEKTIWKPDIIGISDEYVYQKMESELLRIFTGPNKGRLLLSDYVQSFFKSAKQFRSFPVNLLNHKFVHEKTGVIKFSADSHKIIYTDYSVIQLSQAPLAGS